MKRFSIIVPVYNAANTIERCVDSIMANKGDDFEVILIEDCSKDYSREICAQLAAKYPEVACLYNEKNSGVSYTRNRGLEAATGEYLLFVDSDDWISDSYIETFRKIVDKEKDAFVICGYVNHDEKYNGVCEEYQFDRFLPGIFEDSGEAAKIDLKKHLKSLFDHTMLQQLWNKVFVNRIVQENHLRFDERISIGEDFRFILSYLKASRIDKMFLVNRCLYHYMRDQEGSLMYRVGYESIEEPLKNLKSLYEIMGYSSNEIEENLAIDRQKMIENQAYLIFHNVGMGLLEKRKLILRLDESRGKKLFWDNFILYEKEKMAKLRKG